MSETTDEPAFEPALEQESGIFTHPFARFDKPARIVILLGPFLSTNQMIDAQGILVALRKPREENEASPSGTTVRETREGVYNTRTVHALNKGRRWALARLTEQIAPMLEPNIALAVVPSHDPWTTDTPIRELAQQLVALDPGRIDATSCLIRHTRIKRIVFGGPSNRALHRATIRVEHSDLVAGRRVLLLDDIAKSGQSLIACRRMLREAGATQVQMAALGRTV